MKKIILSICFIINVLLIIAQPTNNPYKSSYGTNDSHWTDSLKWSTGK